MKNLKEYSNQIDHMDEFQELIEDVAELDPVEREKVSIYIQGILAVKSEKTA